MKNNFKFTAFLTSWFCTYIKDEEGNKIPVKIEDENKFVTNLKKLLLRKQQVLYVANDPTRFEENDSRAETFFASLRLTGLKFKNCILLDNRNKDKARELILNSDLIIFCGGKVDCQMNFFKKLHLKKILKDYFGVIVGISAGTMNMCHSVYNFPEEKDELGNKPITKGLGFYDEFIVPHCDGFSYPNFFADEPEKFVDTFKDYIIPFSYKHDLIALPNSSYIMLSKDKVTTYGDYYIIRKGKTYKKI